MRRTAAPGIALALLLAACSTAPPPVPLAPGEAARYTAAWEARRAAAYAPQRKKALFRGETVPKIGPSARGYLSVFWDGSTLFWRSSAPLAGNQREGRLRRAGPGAGEPSLLPGGLSEADALGALLGVLDLPASCRPVERVGAEFHLRLDLEGREAVLTEDGRVVSLRFPGKTSVMLEAGEPFPRSVTATGRSGRAHLTLESWAEWPESEPAPGGAA
ncbi:MAG: hypothetical protein ACHQPI_10610 [Thermoanaerobaculia bacterium]